MEPRALNADTPVLTYLVERASICLKHADTPPFALTDELKASYDHHVVECRLILADLERSLILLRTVARAIDDAANARIRARSLHFELSQALNIAIGASNVKSTGDCLDAAKKQSHSISASTESELSTLDTAISSVAAENRSMYALNVAYELLESTDLVLRYKDDGYGPYSLVRSIDLQPEYLGAGLTIIQNFVRILQSRYRGLNVKARIVQAGSSIKLIVDAPEGREEVEEFLSSYAEVLSGHAMPETFAITPAELLDIKSTARIAEAQLAFERDKAQLLERTLGYTAKQLEQTTIALEKVSGHLSLALSNSTMQMGHAMSLAQSHANELLVLLGQSRLTIPELCEHIDVLSRAFSKGVSESDEATVKAAALEIQAVQPTLFAQIRTQVITSTTSTLLIKWLTELGTLFT